jgi:hypothetical protein
MGLTSVLIGVLVCESARWNDPIHTYDVSDLLCRSAPGPHADSQMASLARFDQAF